MKYPSRRYHIPESEVQRIMGKESHPRNRVITYARVSGSGLRIFIPLPRWSGRLAADLSAHFFDEVLRLSVYVVDRLAYSSG